jgi:hypothetical protein
MTADELVKGALGMADDRLKQGEVVMAFCYVHMKVGTERSVLALDYNAAPFSFERKVKQAAIITTIRAIRGNGHFEGAVLVSEAWMKRSTTRPEMPYTKRIADDPERIDTLFLYAYGADGSRRFVAWELKPTTKKGIRYRAPTAMISEEGGYTAEGWFDKAFHDEQQGEA